MDDLGHNSHNSRPTYMGSIGKIWEMLIPAQTKKKHFKAFKKMDPAQKPLHIGFEIMDWDDGLG